jgi:hypothetical protein
VVALWALRAGLYLRPQLSHGTLKRPCSALQHTRKLLLFWMNAPPTICRKGSTAIKVALMVATPMILIDASVNIGRWLHEGSQVVEASDSTVPCQQMKDEYRVSQTDCRRGAD